MHARWSRRVFFSATATWLVLATVYFARPYHPLLPAPLNSILFVTIASASLGALTSWLAAVILDRLRLMVEAQDTRDGRVYFELARFRGEISRIREILEHTEDLSRPVLALAGPDYDAGFADGLARRPAREAKILPMDRG